MVATALVILPGGGTILRAFPGRPPLAMTVLEAPRGLQKFATLTEEFDALCDPEQVYLLRTLEEPWIYYDPKEW